MDKDRRAFIVGAAGLVFARPAVAAVVTPRQTRGPFYPVKQPADSDTDLTRVIGRPNRAQGDAIELSGRVFMADGNPLARGTVEIWQANAFGRYAHPGDPGGSASDPNFQGFGAVRVGADGSYRFRTIMPADYRLGGGNRRAPHVHYRILDESGRDLTTQMYFPGDPFNADDWIYSRLGSDDLRQAATAQSLGEGRFLFDLVVA